MSGPTPVPVHLVRGDDEGVLAEAVRRLVAELVGEGDRDLVVEELDLDRYGDDGGWDISPVVDAAQTPPFLTDRRVVVARRAGVFGTKDAVAPLVAYLADPLPTTSLVLAWERDPRPGAKLAAVPRSLLDAVRGAGGEVVDASVGGRPRERAAWLDDEVRRSGLAIDARGRQLLGGHLGDDVARAPAILAGLVATYGPGARLGPDELAPYLGEAGDVAPWDLTDAIDGGDVAGALAVLQRMTGAGGRHPLQVMAVLHGHYARMLRLDGSGATSEREAADVLGVKGSTFPARKALAQLRRLGGERVGRFVELLADADVDLRGARAWPDQLVVEVLVARLAGRSRGRA